MASRQDADQVGQPLAPLKEALQKLLEGVFFAFHPIRRNALPGLVDHLLGEVHDLVQPGLKVVQGAHRLVDQAASVKTLQGRFGEIPVRPVEGVTVVDHAGHKTGTPRPSGRSGFSAPHQCAVEHRLAAIGVARPLVEHQDGAEILQVDHLGQKRVGEEIVDRGAAGVAGVARAEVPAGLDGDALRPEVQVDFRVGGQELGADLDQGRLGSGNLEVVQQRRRRAAHSPGCGDAGDYCGT